MLLPDVNAIVYAFRQESPRHSEWRGWLEDAVNGPEIVGASDDVLSAFLRLVTHRRVYREPSSPEAALAFCSVLLSAPRVLGVRPGPRHWATFTELVATMRLRANDIPDAYLAAVAIEQDATLVTADRGFARFPGLRMRHPLAG